MSARGISILGATGSIGRSTLRVLDQLDGSFRPVALTANRSVDALADIVGHYRPRLAVVADADVNMPTDPSGGAEWRRGGEALIEAATHPDAEIVLNALVGAAGLASTIAALRAGKRVALANKESLVCAGPLVRQAESEGGGQLIPVDSEHSAIFQCLQGCAARNEVRKLVLTASGGPFREWTEARLSGVQRADALRHPTWDMGAKITIDSSTLANKALEVIEAHHLFGMSYDDIETVVHPQSIIHSMVEFVDGSVLAQMGFPSMEIPILYALTYPDRVRYESRRFDPIAAGSLSFEAVRHDAFPIFGLGVEAGRTGGTAPAVFNAANEVAVAAFLEDRLDFPGIPAAVGEALDRWEQAPLESIDDVWRADAWARRVTDHFVRSQAFC